MPPIPLWYPRGTRDGDLWRDGRACGYDSSTFARRERNIRQARMPTASRPATAQAGKRVSAERTVQATRRKRTTGADSQVEVVQMSRGSGKRVEAESLVRLATALVALARELLQFVTR